MARFNTAITNSITVAVQQAQAQQQPQGQQGQGNAAMPIIAIKILWYKGDTSEYVLSWLLQTHNIFWIQGINDSATKIYYTATSLQGATLYWYLNKV